MVKLGSIADVVYHRIEIQDVVCDDGNVAVVGANHGICGWSNEKPTSTGKVTSVWEHGDAPGTVKYYDMPMITSKHVYVITPKDGVDLMPEYLYLMVKSREAVLLHSGAGTVMQHVRLDFILDLDIGSVPPCDVQRRVVRLYGLVLRFERLLCVEADLFDGLMKCLLDL